MLDSRVFNTSREVARDKLSAEEAKNSFGYYIDIPSCWETSQYPAQMINVLGIHKTHAEHFLEIIEDLGPLSQYDIDWARRYVDFYNHIICHHHDFNRFVSCHRFIRFEVCISFDLVCRLLLEKKN